MMNMKRKGSEIRKSAMAEVAERDAIKKARKKADEIRKAKRGTGTFKLGNTQESNAEVTGSEILTMRGVRTRKPHGMCCIEVFKKNMPEHFRPCPDCPNKKLEKHIV